MVLDEPPNRAGTVFAAVDETTVGRGLATATDAPSDDEDEELLVVTGVVFLALPWLRISEGRSMIVRKALAVNQDSMTDIFELLPPE
jgi:hypothetical protein